MKVDYSTCLHASRMINHVGVKMKQPPVLQLYMYNNRRFEGRAGSGLHGPLY